MDFPFLPHFVFLTKAYKRLTYIDLGVTPWYRLMS